MEMMSPERQRVTPFFLGGEVILVSYPTHELSDRGAVLAQPPRCADHLLAVLPPGRHSARVRLTVGVALHRRTGPGN